MLLSSTSSSSDALRQAPAQQPSGEDFNRRLDEADQKANEAFKRERAEAEDARIYTCSGPCGNGPVFLPPPKSHVEKMRDKRWEQVIKK